MPNFAVGQRLRCVTPSAYSGDDWFYAPCEEVTVVDYGVPIAQGHIRVDGHRGQRTVVADRFVPVEDPLLSAMPLQHDNGATALFVTVVTAKLRLDYGIDATLFTDSTKVELSDMANDAAGDFNAAISMAAFMLSCAHQRKG